MAKEIKGILQSKTAYVIYNIDENEHYPTGRQLRGSIGYIALQLTLPVADKFPDFEWDGIIFRDLLPISKCGSIFFPDKNGLLNICPKCGEKYDKTLLREIITPKYKHFEMPENNLYRLSIIVQDEKYFNDIIGAMEFIYQHGANLGSKISNGFGRFSLREYEVTEARKISKNNVKLISHAIVSGGNKKITFSKYIESKSSFDTISAMAISKGSQLTMNHNGYFIGKYGGLGFGEITI